MNHMAISEDELRAQYPQVDWDADINVNSTDCTPTKLAAHVVQHMPKIWAFVVGRGTPDLIVALAAGNLQDVMMPYTTTALHKHLSDAHPSAFHDEFLEWQSKALAVRFSPKQHLVLSKQQTVPFRDVPPYVAEKREDSFGRVFKVEDVDTGECFARKTGRMEQLTPELDVLMRLPDSTADHCVQLRCSYQIGNQLHIVTAPFGDTDLQQFFQHKEILPMWASSPKDQKAALLTGWMNCLAVGLAQLHNNPEGCITHKDIKPANILLVIEDQAVRPLFSNFGTPKHCPKYPMHSGVVVASEGTFDYSAPEERQGCRYIGRAADVFSLGCVFLEVAYLIKGKSRRLAKRMTGSGYSSSAFIAQKQYHRHLVGDNPWWGAVRNILDGMLEYNPHLRWTAAKVAEEVYAMEEAAGRAPHCRYEDVVVTEEAQSCCSDLSVHDDTDSHDTDEDSSDYSDPSERDTDISDDSDEERLL